MQSEVNLLILFSQWDLSQLLLESPCFSFLYPGEDTQSALPPSLLTFRYRFAHQLIISCFNLFITKHFKMFEESRLSLQTKLAINRFLNTKSLNYKYFQKINIQ